MAMSPTARTLEYMRNQGASPWVVEKWNPFAHIRQDLYGFIDVVALRPGEQGLLGIQATTDSHGAERVTKIQGIDVARLWLSCKNPIWVMTWAQRGGKRKWTPKITPLTLAGQEIVAGQPYLPPC